MALHNGRAMRFLDREPDRMLPCYQQVITNMALSVSARLIETAIAGE